MPLDGILIVCAIAGMLLAESQFATQFRADVGSLRTLFVTLFFTSIGMLANPGWFLSNWYLALFWLVVVFALKALMSVKIDSSYFYTAPFADRPE